MYNFHPYNSPTPQTPPPGAPSKTKKKLQAIVNWTEITTKFRKRRRRRIPKPLIEGLIQLIWYEGFPTKWASLLTMINPTVHTPFMEYVLAIPQPSNLLMTMEFMQAHSTALGRPGTRPGSSDITELHHWQKIADHGCGYGYRHEFRPGFRPRGVGLD
uniref:Uncharacterized protein n=1 Tax=Opuntia streptacantha TaxID=393608 RepID=A0A7C8ZI45_OPUST